MAEVYKILGQVATTDTTEQVLYTSPASTQSIITNITVVNRTSSAQTFDVNVYNSAKVSGDLIAVATNTIFAVANGSTTGASSTDGITWTLRTLSTTGSWRSVTYGNGTFVAVSYGSTTGASSTDGITWVTRTLPASANWKSITYGNGTFVAVAQSTTTGASSTDGITWVTRTLPSSGYWSSVAYGNGIFVAVAYASTKTASSTDGITWTLRTLPNAAWQLATFGEPQVTSRDFNTL
jgi:hypothetical protein